MKIVAFVKGLRLLFKRRGVLMKSENIRSSDFRNCVYMSVFIFITVAVFSTVCPPFAIIKVIAKPRPVYGYFLLADFSFICSFDAQTMRALAVILLGIFASAILMLYKCLAVMYKICLQNIASKRPMRVNHGNTIAEVLRGVRSEPVEYLAIFDPHGRKVEEATIYDPNEVRCSNEGYGIMQRYSGCIKIHNHPSTGSGFSPNDISSAISCRVSKTIVVAQKLVYTLELTPECWELDDEAVQERLERAFEHRMKPVKKITDDEWAAFILGINAMLAEQYGMKLTIERFEDCQYLCSKAAISDTYQQAGEPMMTCSQPVKPAGSWRVRAIDLLKKICDI